GCSRPDERISNPQAAFHPQMSKGSTLPDTLGDPWNIGCADSLGVTPLIPVEHSDLFRPYGVEEERRVRGHQQLRAPGGSSALLREFWQQARVKKVFRLFNTNELRRLWVVKHKQVGEHLQGTVRRKPSKD